MTRDGRRIHGRRWSDRWRLALGVALGLGLAAVAGVQHGCDAKGPSSPEPVAQAAPPPASASTTEPPAAAPPAAVPGPSEGREVTFSYRSSGKVKNTSGVAQEYWVCAMTPDLQLLASDHAPSVPDGAEWSFDLDADCNQTDLTQNGCNSKTFHAINATWYGVDGQPVSDPRKVDWKACYPDCDEGQSWRELEPEVELGEWGACAPAPTIATGSHNGPKCQRAQTKTVSVYEVNGCTEARRLKSKTVTIETEPCECPAVCANTPASSSAAQGFTLPNSSEATETAWADANVQLGPFKLIDKDDFQHED